MKHDTFGSEIMNAIGAHGAWKSRLRTAAVHKDTDLSVAEIKRDDCCKFGQWFHGLPANVRSTQEAETVRKLHKEFHQLAGSIASKIVDQKFDDAISDIEGTAFSALSDDLKAALMTWRRGGSTA